MLRFGMRMSHAAMYARLLERAKAAAIKLAHALLEAVKEI